MIADEQFQDTYWVVRLSNADEKPHMYIRQVVEEGYASRYFWHDGKPCMESHYGGQVVYFERRVFRDWSAKPNEIMDTFAMFGCEWVVLERLPYEDALKCVVATPANELLALVLRLHETEMRVWGNLTIAKFDEKTFRHLEG